MENEEIGLETFIDFLDEMEITEESALHLTYKECKEEMKKVKGDIKDLKDKINETEGEVKIKYIKEYLKYIDESYSTLQHTAPTELEAAINMGIIYTGLIASLGTALLMTHKISKLKDDEPFLKNGIKIIGKTVAVGTGVHTGCLAAAEGQSGNKRKQKLLNKLLTEHKKYQNMLDKLEKEVHK